MRVTVKEWAARNGVSERAVRARLARGTLPGTKERDPSTGAELWYVDVPERSSMADAPVETHGSHSIEGLDSLVALLREKDQTILELAGRCGWLQSELQQTRDRLESAEQEIRLLQAPAASSGNTVQPLENSGYDVQGFAPDPAPAPTSHPSHRSAPTANGQDSGAECPPRPPWWKFWTKFMVLFV